MSLFLKMRTIKFPAECNTNNSNSFFILKNNNIKLKEISIDDLDYLCFCRASDDAYNYFFEWEQISFEKQKAWYCEYKNNPNEKLFIINNKKDSLGTIGLSNISQRNRRAELSHFFIVSDVRGKGCGDDAINILIDYAKNYLNIRRLYCHVLSTNEKAIKFYKNQLFKEEGTLREHVFKNGKYLDVQIMGKILIK